MMKMSSLNTDLEETNIKGGEISKIGVDSKRKIPPKVVMRFENLTKHFGKFVAVDNVNIEVYEGETIGLIGPNGAGKTTTIKMIAKLLRPTSGQILVLNKMDLADTQENANLFADAVVDTEVLQISAKTGAGLNKLKSRIVQVLDEFHESS